MPALPSPEAVREALRSVVDPELGGDVVDLGMVRSVEVGDDGSVVVHVALTVAGCPLRAQLRADVEERVRSLPGVRSVRVEMAEMRKDERAATMARARKLAAERAPTTALPAACRILAVSSGKGGVGKSTLTVNLALALARQGFTVGLLDADIWGFSVPRLLGVRGRLEAEGTPEHWTILPQRVTVGGGVLEVVSMGLLADSENEAIMWRGLLLNRAVQHFVEDVRWGALDYLLVDMPPGTGDVQMGLARLLPRTELLVVTTPPAAASRVAARVADMARKGHLRVVGVVENMSAFRCAHGETYALFGSGGGERLAGELGVPLLAKVPFDLAMAEAAEVEGVLALDADGPAATVLAELARRLSTEVVPPFERSSCTARLLDALGAAASTAEPAR